MNGTSGEPEITVLVRRVIGGEPYQFARRITPMEFSLARISLADEAIKTGLKALETIRTAGPKGPLP